MQLAGVAQFTCSFCAMQMRIPATAWWYYTTIVKCPLCGVSWVSTEEDARYLSCVHALMSTAFAARARRSTCVTLHLEMNVSEE